MGLREAIGKVLTASEKQVICFPGFVFHPPNGLQTLLANKECLKIAALPVFPNVQSAAVNLNAGSLDTQPCRCKQEATSPLAATTHLCNMPPEEGNKKQLQRSLYPTSGAGDTPSMGMGNLCKTQHICLSRASSSLVSEITNAFSFMLL